MGEGDCPFGFAPSTDSNSRPTRIEKNNDDISNLLGVIFQTASASIQLA